MEAPTISVIDLRNSDVFLRDGTSLERSGAVNNVAGYAAIDVVTTMLVDGFTGIVGVGQKFHMDTLTDLYTVTAHSETMGDTTSITFTPALVADVADDDVIILVAAVNHSGGYPVGTTTMIVDGYSGAVSVGQGFSIIGSAEIYSIIAHSETGGKTTSITFAPGLTSSVLDNTFITMLGNIIEIHLGEGTLTYDEKRAVVYVLNRGRIFTVKIGDDAPIDISFQFIWEFLRAGSGEPPTPEEALRQIGAASAWVSSSNDPCEPYSVDIIICNIPPCEGNSEVIILPYFRHESLAHDLKNGTVSVTGKSNSAFAIVNRVG